MSNVVKPTPHDLDDTVIVTEDALETLRSHIRGGIAGYLEPGRVPPSDPDTLLVDVHRFSEVSSYPLYSIEVRPSADAPVLLSAIAKFAPVFSDNNEGLTEYRHLSQMWERLGPAGELRVPRPLDFYEDINALVMQRVGGERFSRVLLKECSRFAPDEAAARMADAARMCGEWLRAYHDTTADGTMAPFSGSFLADVQGKLDYFGQLGFPPGVARRVRETVERLADWGHARRIAVADRHGDYGPQNVHRGDGYIYVFDLNYHVTAPVLEDVVYFLVTLETLNPYPSQWFLDRRRVMALRPPFLAGYFGDTPADEVALLVEGYYLKALLFRCAKQRRNTSKRGALAERVFDALRVRRYYPRRLSRQCALIDRLLDAGGGA